MSFIPFFWINSDPMTKYLKRFIFFCLLIYVPPVISGQCPERDSVLSDMVKIRQRNADKLALSSKLIQYSKQYKECKNADDSLSVALLIAIGNAFSNMGDAEKGISFRKQAIDRARGIEGDPSLQNILLVNAYYQLVYDYSLTNIQLSLDAADSCVAVDRRINGNYFYSCNCLRDKTQILHYNGDYKETIRYAEMGESYNANYAPLIKLIRPNYDSVGFDFYYFTYRIEAMIFLGDFLQAERLVNQKLDYFLKIRRTGDLGTIYNLLGVLYDFRRDYQSAKKYFLKAFENSKDYIKGGVQALAQIGMIYEQKLNKPDSAILYCSKALKYADEDDSMYLLNLMANAYSKKNDFERALTYYEHAYEKLGLGSHLSNNILFWLHEEREEKIIENVTGLLMDWGASKLREYKLKYNQKSLEEAINIFTITDHALSKIKIGFPDKDTKLFWRSHSRRLYEFAIEACFLANQKQKAFYFLEKGRAVILNEQLSDQKWLNNDQILQQKLLADQIKKQDMELQAIDKSSPQFLKHKTEIVTNQEKLKDLTQRLRENNPLYYQSYLDTAMIQIDDVRQKILRGDGSFIELFVGDSAVYSLVVTKNEIFFNRIDKVRYEKLIRELKADMVVPINSVEAVNSQIQKSHELYVLLFKGIILPESQVIISPDGEVFPFEVLVKNSSGPPRYFIEDHAVSYTYSARYLLNIFTGNAYSSGNLLGFAPIKFARVNGSLADLSGSDRSLNNLKTHFGNSTEYVGENATKRNFLKIFPQYSVLQLYTHASSSSGADEPVIYFYDSALYLSELVPEIKPSTQLIVLSACETGKGHVYEGEGTFSFNRSFAAIGIPAAITTLWSVESESTYRLTELFYKYLSEGDPTSVALRKAKLEFLKTASKEKTQPYYWAGHILSGKSEKIELSKYSVWKWVGTGLGLALAITLLYWARKRASK